MKKTTKTQREIMSLAHQIARETKDAAGSYRIALSCALKDIYEGLYDMDEKFYSIAEWIRNQKGISALAFSSRQIVKSSDKAVCIRIACKWYSGLDIVKDVWVPKSQLTEIAKVQIDVAEFNMLSFDNDSIIESIENNENVFEFSQKYCKRCAACFA